MKKYFCDLCETETQTLECHDFTQWVEVSEVTDYIKKRNFFRFFVCDSCRDIFWENANAMVERVKYLCALTKKGVIQK